MDTGAYEQGHIDRAVGWNWQSQLQQAVRRDLASPEEIEALMSPFRYRQRYHGDSLRRQQQLVCGLGFLAVEILRPPGCAPDERRPGQVGSRGPPADHRGSRSRPGHLQGRPRRPEHPRLPRPGAGAGSTPAPFRWWMCAPRPNTAANCWPRPICRRRVRSAAATSPAPPMCPGRRRWPRMAPSSRPTNCASFTAARASTAAGKPSPTAASGERSSHTWFVLTQLLGLEQVRNYDGSLDGVGQHRRRPHRKVAAHRRRGLNGRGRMTWGRVCIARPRLRRRRGVDSRFRGNDGYGGRGGLAKIGNGGGGLRRPG